MLFSIYVIQVDSLSEAPLKYDVGKYNIKLTLSAAETIDCKYVSRALTVDA